MNIKKVALLIFLITNYKGFSQNRNIDFFSNNVEQLEDSDYSEETIESFDPIPVPTPINDYLPLLAVAAVGLGFYYRKEINQTIKSN